MSESIESDLNEEYILSLSLENLRDEYRRNRRIKSELRLAIRDRVEMISGMGLHWLGSVAMGCKFEGFDLYDKGKELQMELGLDAIPPRCEYEHAAGLWWLILQGLKSETPDVEHL